MSLQNQASRELTESQPDIDLADTFFPSLPDESTEVETSVSERVEPFPLYFDISSDTFLNKEDVILEQGRDPELISISKKALSEQDSCKVPVCYFMKNGLLMRKWRPSDVPADHDWEVVHQVVVPKCYRSHIMSVAHDEPMSGHLGVGKTFDRILHHFYWPNLKQSVAEHCKTCHVCQMVGKPNQNPPKAPLKPIPVFDEPFSKVIIDCVGPLPKSRLGHEYILTIMCSSTRYAEAIPLRSIKAKPVGEALKLFFTRFGLPKIVQSDQGTNFTSKLFRERLGALGITQVTSSAYHPQSQGALERFHQTLKSMMRTYCFDHSKDWDEGLPFLLFAIREVVNESLGYSPFELVFGRSVRGPLALIKEKCLADKPAKESILNYVLLLKERLKTTCEFAQANLKSVQSDMKTWYDRKARDRCFNVGDQVLVLLPVLGQPLQARYSGPYVIDRKVGDLDYILTPDRRKPKQLCHVNMIKPYYVRKMDVEVKTEPVASVTESEPITDALDHAYIPGCNFKLSNSVIIANLPDKLDHLTKEQQSQIINLILDYKCLFPDVPGKTDVVAHDVDDGNAQPIKQHPYRCGPLKQAQFNEEIRYMKENDIIEDSDSSWSSPCILIPKPDLSFRFCTDFRKVNLVSKSDTYPLPRIDDCIDKVGKAKFVSTYDLLKGYWQVPLTPRAKRISAFVTPQGLYQYKVLPFGMKNAPATFQRLMNQVISELPNTEVYIDDIILYSNSWEEHMNYTRALYKKLAEAQLTVNLAKSQISKAKVTFLGHVIGQGKVQPIHAKVDAIVNFPQPKTKKELMRFLGMAGYYRKFCRNFSDVVSPLTNLLSKNAKFVWNGKCVQAFLMVKTMLGSAPILSAPDFTKPFMLAVDASDVGVGSVLLQEDDFGVCHPVCYFSKKLNSHQRNYATIEKEALAVILAVQHFEVYLYAAARPIVIFSDHNPLTFVHKMKNKNQRLLRWSLTLQEFDLVIQHIKGRDNLIADALSRCF